MTIFINPGTGSVLGADEHAATENIKALVKDIGIPGVKWKRKIKRDYGCGRFCFVLKSGSKKHEVQMPGIHLDRVRFVGSEGQNIWDFPRLYIDGMSWVWKYALQCMFQNDEE